MNIFNKLFKPAKPSDVQIWNDYEIQIWNKFIDTLCSIDEENLTDAQRTAVLVFRYDAETNHNGHSAFFEYYPWINSDELIASLEKIGAAAFIDNFRIAAQRGEDHDHLDTDRMFGTIRPSLSDILTEYVISHANELGIKL